jgi:hypothetical protein
MAFFQILAGCYKQQIAPGKYNPKVFEPGDIFQDERDLVKKFGSGKFRKLSDKEIAEYQAQQKKPKVSDKKVRINKRREMKITDEK